MKHPQVQQSKKWPGPPIDVDSRIEDRVRKPAAGQWSKLIYVFCCVMSSDEVVLLSFLYHHRDVCSPSLPEEFRQAGWFWCQVDTIQRYIFWGDVKQRRVLQKLKAKGFVDVEQHRKRTPKGVAIGQPVRWIRINSDQIVLAIDNIIRKDSCGGSVGDLEDWSDW